MRTPAQNSLDRFAAAILAALPDGYPLPEASLLYQLRTRSHPPALDSECRNSVAFMESTGRCHGTRTETGVVWTLTTAGRAWHEQNP